MEGPAQRAGKAARGDGRSPHWLRALLGFHSGVKLLAALICFGVLSAMVLAQSRGSAVRSA